MKNKTNNLLLLLAVMLSSVAHAQLVQPEWSKNAVMYEVNVRQYSEKGDFKSVTKDLPRIKSLGVDVLWIMPIHPIGVKNRKGGLGSYYSVKNYTEVSQDYGTKADFKALVDAAHKLGMKVLIDWVANHTAWDHPWISTNKDWYVQNDKGEIVTQYDWTDVAKLNFDNSSMRDAMVEDMKYWVRDFDIDGFRCDVAFLVPLDFWLYARKSLEEIKPVYLLAEMEWNADITPTPNEYFVNAFNASYGWNFMGVTSDFAKGQKELLNVKLELKSNYKAFPSHMHKLYFLTNHDENSWNGTVDEKYGKNWQQFGVLVYTLPQSLPLIYTGEEVGLTRRLKFFEKDPITKVEWSNKLREEWYKKMTNLKHTVPAFYNSGGMSGWSELAFESTGSVDNEIFAYKRENGTSEAFVIVNFSGREITLKNKDLNFSTIQATYKVESNAKQTVNNEELMIRPNSYVIYYK